MDRNLPSFVILIRHGSLKKNLLTEDCTESCCATPSWCPEEWKVKLDPHEERCPEHAVLCRQGTAS